MKKFLINALSFSIISLSLISCGEQKEEQVVSNKKILLSASKYSFEVGEKITFEVKGINVDTSKIIVESKNKDIVDIENSNYLVAKSVGTAEIFAYFSDDDSVNTSMSLTVTKGNVVVDFNYYQFDQYYGRRKSLNSLGEVNVLVLPIAVKDFEANATKENLENLNKVFNSYDSTDLWESVSSFYYKSSYNKLKMNFIIPDEWYQIGLNPLEIQKTYNIARSGESDGGSGKVTELAYNWYKEKYNPDLTTLDKNGDGWVDAIWTVYSSPTMGDNATHWETVYPGIDASNYWAFTTAAFQYNNIDTPTNKSNPLPKVYSWASYDFMSSYTSGSKKFNLDSHTYIHETGHMLGLKDYYCSSSSYYSQLGGIDMMDLNIGDHHAFSKFALGWIKPKIVQKEMKVELKPIATSGEALIIASDTYNNTAFDEYFMVEYVTPEGLNEQDYKNKYSYNDLQGYNKSGIRITHVDNPAVGSNGTYSTYVQDPADFKNDPNLNSEYFGTYYEEGGENKRLDQYLITMMQKNVGNDGIKSVMDNQRQYLKAIVYQDDGSRKQDPNDSLFFENESFSLKRGSKYRDLMPSKSAKLSKYYYTNDENDYFDYEINVESLDSEKAIIDIKKIDRKLL